MKYLFIIVLFISFDSFSQINCGKEIKDLDTLKLYEIDIIYKVVCKHKEFKTNENTSYYIADVILLGQDKQFSKQKGLKMMSKALEKIGVFC